MMAELAKNSPLHSTLPRIRNSEKERACSIVFGHRKRKTGNLVVPSSELFLFVGQITFLLGTKRPYLPVLGTKI